MLLLLVIWSLALGANGARAACEPELERGAQLNLDFEFPEAPLLESDSADYIYNGFRSLRNKGWTSTSTSKHVGGERINDLTILAPPDTTGRIVVLPYTEIGHAPLPLTELDQTQIAKVQQGSLPYYVAEAAVEKWQARLQPAQFTGESLKDALKALGFVQTRCLRKATIREGNHSYRGDGVVVMEADWSLSRFTILDRQPDPVSLDEGRLIANALSSRKKSYSTQAAVEGLKRKWLTIRLW